MKTKIAAAMPKLGEFIPVMKPAYATYDEVIAAHGGRTFAEVKHDGYRIQIHRGGSRFWMFTANGNPYNYACYPEIVSIVKHLPVCIVEAELVAEGRNHKEAFDNVKRRFRRGGIGQDSLESYLQSGIVGDVPLSLMVFDVLRFERTDLIGRPFEERTEYTQLIDSAGIVPVDQRLVQSAGELEFLVQSTIKSGGEGIVCKNPDSPYRPGCVTSDDWVKFKRSESLDLVIVGFYKSGKHDLDLPFTSVLVAAYNDGSGMYETLGKIGVTRDGIAREIESLVGQKRQPQRPGNVAFSQKLDRPSCEKFVPDSYIDPEQSVVLEVRAMNLNRSGNWQTCGEKDGKAFSMRIGWADQVRYDKGPKQATRTSAIAKLYQLQEGGVER
ncbi:ATP-dependent DNA ligase [Candidatus Woesearchaeota archaeon]|nr:ATP-dependent DNA ligase [Candidatus Woesearchaeota archaeon]